MGGDLFPHLYQNKERNIMNCKKCEKEITNKNRKIVNGGLYKSRVCKPCYNAKISVYNKKRQQALKESRWF